MNTPEETLPPPQSDAFAVTMTGGGDRPAAPARAMFGRYLVIGRLGRGGMGEVFTAYDPELDRKVALKRVRVEDRARGDRRARLLREAQAMAKIRHPNVVAVYDVGQLDDEIFIAMELVDGEALRGWMGRTQAVEEIVAVFVQAARGLAAAHDNAVVHRDFKPDNAMIDRSGRVQVLDFGLAATANDGDAEASVVGSPAYMAPEQYAGAPPDALSDQFALCVALFEALHGRRPFVGETIAALAAAVTRGELAEPAEPRKIPRWLDLAVRRGLATAPSDRWPDLAALIAELESGLARGRRGRRRGWAIAAGLAASGVVALRFATAPTCDDAAAPVDALWNTETRATLTELYEGATTPLGRDSWPGLSSALDRRAQDWSSAYREACEAARDGDQEEIERADRQRVCLHGQLRSFEGALDVLGIADADVIERAPLLIAALPAPRDCERGPGASPAVDGAAHERARRVAATAEALLLAAKPAVAKARLTEALAEFAEDPAARAELGVLAAAAARALGELESAGAHLEAADLAARETGDHRWMLAVAQESLAIAIDRRDPDEADRWIARARVEARALGDERTLAILDGKSAQALSHRGDFAGAIATGERALAEFERLGYVESKDAVDLVSNIGGYHFSLRQYDEALKHKRTALERLGKLFEPGHPMTARLISDLGVIAMATGDFEGGRRKIEEALAILEGAFDEPHPGIGETLASLAGNAARRSDLAASVQLGERALANLIPTIGDSPQVALVYNNYSVALQRVGRHADAVAAQRSAIAIKERLLAPDHPDLALAYSNFAKLIAEDGNDDEVRSYYERALSIRIKRDEPEPLAALRVRFALWLARKGESATARILAEQALAVPTVDPAIHEEAVRALALADQAVPAPPTSAR